MKKKLLVLLLAIFSVVSVWSYEYDIFRYDLDAAGTGIKIKGISSSVMSWDIPKKIIIPEEIEGMPVTTIGKSAFESNKITSEYVLPKTLKVIEDRAFFGSAIQTVVLSTDIYYGRRVYACCDYLKEVVIPENFGIVICGKKVVNDPWGATVKEDQKTALDGMYEKSEQFNFASSLFEGCNGNLRKITLPNNGILSSYMFDFAGATTFNMDIKKGLSLQDSCFLNFQRLDNITLEEGFKISKNPDGSRANPGIGKILISNGGIKGKAKFTAMGIDEDY